MRRLVLLLCLLPLVTFSQETSRRTCRLLFLGGSANDPDKLQLFDGTRSREVELPRMNLSQPYEMPAGALTLKMLKDAVAEGKPAPATAPSAAVAAEVGDFYLLVTADPANKVAPVRMQVIDATLDRFKPGQMLWYNLTATEVGGKVGSRQLAIKPRARVILDAPATGNQDYVVDLKYKPPGKTNMEPLSETKWTHIPTARTVLFIINEPGSRLPRVLGFPDHPPEPAKKP